MIHRPCAARRGAPSTISCFMENFPSPETNTKGIFAETNNPSQSLLISPWEQAIIKNEDHFALGIGAEKVPLDPFLMGEVKDTHYEEEWIVVTEGRIDFEITEDANKAKISCVWQEPEEKYKEYEGLDKAPQGVPYVSDIGTTNSYLENGKPKRAEIFMFAGANAECKKLEPEDVVGTVSEASKK